LLLPLLLLHAVQIGSCSKPWRLSRTRLLPLLHAFQIGSRSKPSGGRYLSSRCSDVSIVGRGLRGLIQWLLLRLLQIGIVGSLWRIDSFWCSRRRHGAAHAADWCSRRSRPTASIAIGIPVLVIIRTFSRSYCATVSISVCVATCLMLRYTTISISVVVAGVTLCLSCCLVAIAVGEALIILRRWRCRSIAVGESLVVWTGSCSLIAIAVG
jgi:hypothetical protein